jgi:hypothetical protein
MWWQNGKDEFGASRGGGGGGGGMGIRGGAPRGGGGGHPSGHWGGRGGRGWGGYWGGWGPDVLVADPILDEVDSLDDDGFEDDGGDTLSTGGGLTF